MYSEWQLLARSLTFMNAPNDADVQSDASSNCAKSAKEALAALAATTIHGLHLPLATVGEAFQTQPRGFATRGGALSRTPLSDRCDAAMRDGICN